MLDSPFYLRDSTGMHTDPFSEILKFADAESLVTGGFTAGGDWALHFPPPDKIKFFAIVKGSCWVMLEGHPEPIHFCTGDVGLLNARRAFIVASSPEIKPVDAMSVFKAGERNYAALGEGKEFEYMGGHVLLDPNRGQMLAQVLPQWIHIPAASPQATSFRWLLDRLIAERETAQPGTQLASAQLSQLLFIQILRAHLQTSHSLPAGLLRALGDARLAPALQRIHANPARHWHLEELAKACAMSRTTFAQYFRNVSGITPGAYLTQWRMRLAEKALREQAVQIAMVAQSLGYTSESAFSNAFKRETGLSPKAWRNAARSPAS